MRPENPIHRLGEFLKKILHYRELKKWEKKEKEAKKAAEDRQKAEKTEAREREKRRKEAEDAGKDYNLRQAKQDRIESADALQRVKREEVKNKLEQFISAQGARGSAYLFNFNELARDDTLVRNLKTLIDQSPVATNIIKELVTGGIELHTDPAKLINLSRGLLIEAERHGGRAAIGEFLSAIQERVNNILLDTIIEQTRQEGIRDPRYINFQKWFEENTRFKLTPVQEALLQRSAQTGNADIKDVLEHLVDEMFTDPPQRQVGDTEDTSWTNVRDGVRQPGEPAPPKQLVSDVEGLMQDLTQAEEAGSHLTPEQLGELYRNLQKAESHTIPLDMVPDSKTYNREVASAHRYVNERLDAVARALNRRLKTEKVQVPSGITDPKKFLEQMELKPGHLGYLLADSPKMMDLLVGNVAPEDIEKSVRFRNQVFLTTHKKILNDIHSSSGDNFGLYERADFSTFLDVLSSKMAEFKRPESRESFGQTWVNWYVNLSSTLRLSRDIDFYASQPGVSIDDWAKSFSLMKNELTSQGMALPAVEQAYRALETTLRSIRDSNDNYIPPSMVGYDPTYGTNEWDNLSAVMLQNMSKAGVVYDVARDPYSGFHVAEADGKRIKLGNKIDFEKLGEEETGQLELKMYMTMAKGFGLASLRFLEIFANARVPGSIQPATAMENFHSMPYEGPARSLNYVNTVLHKWKFGSYRYMQIMNTLLPRGEKIPHMDEKQAWKAWSAYLDETFEKKYEKYPGVKRMIDKLNFSGMSSGFGSNYTWRQLDSTIGWSDKQRELLGGPVKILLSGKLAERLVKDHFVTNRYRQKFRELMQEKGQPTAGPQFDALWQERGLPMYNAQIEKDWAGMNKEKKKELIKEYKRAIVARSWVETAMRNPLAVAHALEVKVEDEITGQVRKVRLHNLIVHKVLGISPEDTKYANLESQAAAFASPTTEQKKYIKEILGLEQDIAAVRELAINGNRDRGGDEGNRDLTEEDFNILGGGARQEQAIKYWKLTQQALFGNQSPESLYDEFGLKVLENGQDYGWEREKIENIAKKGGILDRIGSQRVSLDGFKISALLNEKLADKDWDVTIGTDSTSFRQLDLLNLGSRQWVRLAGDAAAHFHGGERVGQFFTDDLKPNAQPEDLAKAMFEIRKMYEGDAIEAGWKVNSFLANMAIRLYGLDPLRAGSPAQLDVWNTRRNVAAWFANGRRKFTDALEHMGVLPPEPEAWGYDIPGGTDIQTLKKYGRATNTDVWVEIILGTIALSVALTFWNAFTAKDEEESGGGGGHD